jgi:hypothetical protein
MAEFLKLLLPRVGFDRIVQIETLLVCVAVLGALLIPRVGRKWFAATGRAFTRFANRRILAIVTAAVLVLLLRAAIDPLLAIHHPAVHDEFSYLLAARTFAAGRLTNAAHPLWEHFESFHILQQPTYMSMYPPAQGLVLAAGIALTDSPWAGVYLANAVACGIFCWMLQGWLPPRWALLGALIAVIRIGTFSYWMNSYWGGTVAAAGGALALGALPRLLRDPRVRDSLALGAGVVILANSRPYEGLVTVIGVALVFLLALARSKPDMVRGLLWKGLSAAAAVVLLGAAATMFYYSRVTGSPFRMPYLLNRDTYAVHGLFVWQKQRPAPQYRHEEFRKFYVQFESAFQQGGERQSLTQHLSRLSRQAQMLNAFYCGPLMLPPFLAGILGFGNRRLRPLVCIGVVFLTGMLLQNWVQPHYVAPICGLLLVVVFVYRAGSLHSSCRASRTSG